MCILCAMKLIKLTLSDSAYNKALELAGGHAVPVEAYVSSEVEDLLDKKAQLQYSRPIEIKPTTNGSPSSPNYSSVMPDTLEQVLAVCKYVYRTRNIPRDERHARTEFLDALVVVAKATTNSQTGLKGVETTTIRDKCTTDRRLGLPGVHIDSAIFVSWLCRPELLRDHLCRKFPRFVNEIHRSFRDWLPSKFETN
jgi:hypothetical protein